MIWQRLFARHATNCLPSNTKYDTIRKREKNSVLSMFGHTKAASVLRHWSLFVLFGENTPNRVASALKYAILIYFDLSVFRVLKNGNVLNEKLVV